MKRLIRYSCALMLSSIAIHARTPAGDRLLAEGAAREARKDWDGAFQLYSKALTEDPTDLLYLMAVARSRFQAAQVHLLAGTQLRSQGHIDEALAEFRRAREFDAAIPAIDQEIAAARSADNGLTPVERMRKQRDEKISRLQAPPELDPPVRTPISLRMTNESSRIFFETLARYAGLAILFDPEYQPMKIASFEAVDATVEEALDNLALLAKSYWKPISRNTIFVTNDSVNKRRDYETQVTRVFYLSSVSSAQEVQEIVNVVRSVVDLQRVFPYATQYAIVARGEADKVALAEKLIRDLDKPRSEVAVDILVIEASKVFSRQVTAAVASTGLNVPVTFSPRSGIQVTTSTSSSSSSSSSSSTASSTTAAVPLSSLGHLSSSDFAITLPGALLQAALSDADTKILQAPQLRIDL